MGDQVERRGTTASEISKSVHYNYNGIFQLMVIKRAEETNNCEMALKFHFAGHILLKKAK
jgi:hypothetical protein